MVFRSGYALATLALFAVEVLIALFVHDELARPFVGDSLAIALVYCGLRAVMPLRVTIAAATAFVIGCAIEIGQYFHLVDLLGLGKSRVARTLLGTSFDARDFLAYAAGAVAVCAIEWMLAARGQRRR